MRRLLILSALLFATAASAAAQTSRATLVDPTGANVGTTTNPLYIQAWDPLSIYELNGTQIPVLQAVTGNTTTLAGVTAGRLFLTVNCSGCAGGTKVSWFGTADQVNYFPLDARQIGIGLPVSSYVWANSTTTAGLTYWELASPSAQIRVTVSNYGSGTVTVTALSQALKSDNVWIANATTSAPLQVTLANTTTNGNPLNVNITGATGTLAVSNASLPLPTGAATAAKQPALGTAGSASSDVLTVQGIASMTALKVDGSSVTQPVSGTVTANAGTGTFAVSASSLPLPSGAATSANQSTEITALQLIDNLPNTLGSTTSGQSGALALGAVTTAAPSYTTAQSNALSLTTAGALRVDGSGATQPVSGSVSISGTPTVAGSGSFTVAQATGTNLHIVCDSGCSSSAGFGDNGAFTFGTTAVNPIAGVFDDTSSNTATENSAAVARITQNKALHVNFRNASGTEIGTSSNPIQVSLANTATNSTAVKVDGSAVTQPVSGSVTVSQGTGTNLHVVCDSGCSSSAGFADNGAFTFGTTAVNPIAGVFDDTATNTATENSAAIARITASKALHVNFRNASGTEIGTSSNPIQVTLANTGANATAVKVDGSAVTQPVSGTVTANAGTGTFTVSGTVTANAGTNLNTSALALESGGNLATVASAVRAEDSASADADKGVALFAVRKATPANTSGTDGDYEALQVSAGRLWVDASGKTLTVDGSGVTQPVSAASLPLPSGAATSAKQPALGTAGTASSDVLTVQGIASMTALKVDGSAVTQPVSGTVSITANSAVNESQINGVAPLMGNGVTGTGSQRVTIASDNSAVAGMGVGATGSAPPAAANYVAGIGGGATGGLLTGVPVCDSQAFLDMTTATTTELVALTASQTIHICHIRVTANGATTMTFKRGTGTNCGTGTTAIDNAIELTAQTGYVAGIGFGEVLNGGASANAVCVTSSAAVNLHVFVRYAKY